MWNLTKRGKRGSHCRHISKQSTGIFNTSLPRSARRRAIAVFVENAEGRNRIAARISQAGAEGVTSLPFHAAMFVAATPSTDVNAPAMITTGGAGPEPSVSNMDRAHTYPESVPLESR